ncbi:Outer membrane receptor proteins, mostly Fe transport [Cyclobacterium xiamenense]|uniref:Outer membrane receptor proteins, mostly Fe transport n=1 Tax=Cyclobacterium xiamenense TaxID=1297121 RepID=A0A1H6U3P3_9BACT|nr:TonB-dependent receptor [Cyclobacterium xiamenense]SEI86978.1 Outer membrane receptor proteins, mostly Fe transport [Cyclobacterium xiamenense]
MKFLLACIAQFLLVFPIFSQITVRGTLVDSNEANPIEYGSVGLYAQADSSLVSGTVSEPDGSFELAGIKPGTYYLAIQFMGYERVSIGDMVLVRGQVLDLETIQLSPNEQLLDMVEVSGSQFTTMHRIDRQVFEASEFLSGQGGTAIDLMRNLPSVSINAEGELSVRGATGFVVMLNGKPIQSDPAVILGQLPANAIKNIEVVTAPSAKYDPEGKAGIINITTEKGATDGTFTQLNTRMGAPSIQDYDNKQKPQRYGADFTLNHRNGDWDLSLGASYLRNDVNGQRIGDVYTVKGDTTTRFPSAGERGFDEEAYSGRFTVAYTPDGNNEFSLGFYGGIRSKDRTADIVYFDNHASINGERLYTMQYYNENLRIRRSDFALGSFDYSHAFDIGSRISSSFLYEYTMLGGPTTNRNLGFPNTDLIYQDEYNTNGNPLHGLRWQVDYQSKPTPWGIVETGYQFRNLNHQGDFVYERKNNETGAFELVPEFSSNVELTRVIHSGYGQLTGQKNNWDYAVGLRMEYMDRELLLQDKSNTVDSLYTYDFFLPYPTASVQYKLGEQTSIKGAYSRRVERTTTFKMNPFPEREHSETLEQGDPSLLPEFIDLVETGLVKDFGENSVYATAYYRHVKNLVNRVNTVYNDTILNRIYSNVGNGRSIGIELGLELNPGSNWKVFAGGNLYRYRISGSFDERPINNAAWVYSINANTSFDFSPTFTAQWSINYLSDRITAQGEDSRFLSPNLVLRKTFMNDRLQASLQWLNMDMGLLRTNEQRISTWRENEFYTTTNYVLEVDMVLLNLSYTLNPSRDKSRFIKSEFGEKEF